MTSRIVIIGGGQAGGWAAKPCATRALTVDLRVVAEEAWISMNVRRCRKRLC